MIQSYLKILTQTDNMVTPVFDRAGETNSDAPGISLGND